MSTAKQCITKLYHASNSSHFSRNHVVEYSDEETLLISN